MDIVIREYQEKDTVQIITLANSLQDYLISIDPIKRIRRMPEFGENKLQSIIDSMGDREGKCFVAEKNGELIGYVAGFISKQSEENLLSVIPTRLAIIKDLYVREGYRDQHVGTLLVDKTEQYFKEKECDAIWLDVFVPNEKAHAFYLRLGYKDRMINMLKSL